MLSAAKQQQQFREVNELKSRLKELQVKYDNSELVRLNTETRLRQVETQLKAALGDEAGEGGASGSNITAAALEVARLEQDNAALRAKIESLQSAVESMEQEWARARLAAETSREEGVIYQRKAESLSKHCDKLRLLAAKYQQQAEQAEEGTAAAKDAAAKFDEKLLIATTKLKYMETESKLWTQLKNDKIDGEALLERMRAQLMQVTREATKKQHELQNDLQSTRQFLEELKLEYAQYSEKTNTEFAAYQRAKTHEYNKLKEEFEAFKTRSEENTQVCARVCARALRAVSSLSACLA